jgi:large subunit ribosomal protein L22
MEIKAQLNYLRIAPRKVRLVADLVRGKSVEQSRAILGFAVKKGSLPLLKLLNQAVANAKNNFKMNDASGLYVSKITVDEGPKAKRWRARARGQGAPIQKKTSHVTLILKEAKKPKAKVAAKKTDLKKVK